jgi:uncharacterized LabA/DUF88 family protein
MNMLSKPTPQPENTRFAAIFLDFENIYYFFKNDFFDPPGLNDHILELLRNLRARLAEEYNLDCIVMNAYADFERLETTPQGALYLLGVDTKNVMGTDHKNAADMRLCIDVLEVLYTRPEIGTFVLVAGDRDYIPVIQHLRRQARHVLGVGFRESVSGDLLLNLGEEQFLDARALLDPQTMEILEARRTEQLRLREERQHRFATQSNSIESRARAMQAHTSTPASQENVAATDVAPFVAATFVEEPVEFAPVRDIFDEEELECLKLVLEKLQKLQTMRNISELWLGPFLRQLADEMPALADFERRRVLDGLARSGAIRIEKRQGDPYPFSVVIVNYKHPQVVELNPG